MSDKIEELINSLREVLESGKNVDVAEVPFINFNGDIAGKGLIWSGEGNNKQFIFANNPNRFFVSEDIDLAKNKSFSINSINVLNEKELGPTVIKSNLREVGRLKGLNVDGSVSINQYLVYDATTDRLGIGTDQPKATFNILDLNVDIIIGASDLTTAFVGTFNNTDLDIGTDNTSRISVKANGNIVLGNYASGDTKVNVIGSVGINVDNTDPRADLHVNGAIKFNNKLHLSGSASPQDGSFVEGDIVWNNSPKTGNYIGWTCVVAGTPGIWKGFGKIE